MAYPVADSYNCASGGVISAGRYRISGNHRISIWGQSNAVGWATRSDIGVAPLSSDPELATYAAGTFSRVYIWNGTAYAQLNSTNHKSSGTDKVGAEFGIAVRWMRETTSGNLYIEKEAVGNVSIDFFVPGGTFYNAAKARRVSADAWLATSGITVTDTGWLWIQGEFDYQQTQAWYQTRLETLLSNMLADGIRSASTKQVLINMVPGSFCYSTDIVAAKAAVAASLANTTSTAMVPVFANYMNASDLLHVLARGQVYMGYRAFESFFNAPHIGI